jgi:hypothetical protein
MTPSRTWWSPLGRRHRPEVLDQAHHGAFQGNRPAVQAGHGIEQVVVVGVALFRQRGLPIPIPSS